LWYERRPRPCAITCFFFSLSFSTDNHITQRSYRWTDDGHGWVLGDPPSVIRSGRYGWPKPPIRHP
jgi:hypothetical protein